MLHKYTRTKQVYFKYFYYVYNTVPFSRSITFNTMCNIIFDDYSLNVFEILFTFLSTTNSLKIIAPDG